ncbi:hypothetical protein GCM10025734_10230 [Kitasatospora paranensis]
MAPTATTGSPDPYGTTVGRPCIEQVTDPVFFSTKRCTIVPAAPSDVDLVTLSIGLTQLVTSPPPPLPVVGVAVALRVAPVRVALARTGLADAVAPPAVVPAAADAGAETAVVTVASLDPPDGSHAASAQGAVRASAAARVRRVLIGSALRVVRSARVCGTAGLPDARAPSPGSRPG